jgi:hypothetical protein
LPARHDGAYGPQVEQRALIPEAPFLFSICGLSLSLAGLAGLVATLRRGGEFSTLDRFRLREIVEFSFANAIFALSLIPLSRTLDDPQTAVRIVGAAAIPYQVVYLLVLVRRQRARGLIVDRSWGVLGVTINVLMFGAAVACIVSGAIVAYEWLLILFLARPMLAFILVLGSFERPD